MHDESPSSSSSSSSPSPAPSPSPSPSSDTPSPSRPVTQGAPGQESGPKKWHNNDRQRRGGRRVRA
ncbi:MAG TPA: hypothetical protein VJK54_03300, partial [Chthoniobacterales bacterium]|nr:hypothetical protein [Chthoniobacterales bacterium]